MEELVRSSTGTPVSAQFAGVCEPTNPGGYLCTGWFVPAHPAFGAGVLAVRGSRRHGRRANSTANEAQYLAALDALAVLRESVYRGPVLLKGHSLLVVKQYNLECHCGSQRLHSLLVELNWAATEFARVDLLHVRRDNNKEAVMEARNAYEGIDPLRRRFRR